VTNCADLLQSVAEESQQQTRITGKQVAELQEQLDGIAEKHKATTEDLYVKFAAVLNEKKRKAVELKNSLETAQATLQVFAAPKTSVCRCRFTRCAGCAELAPCAR